MTLRRLKSTFAVLAVFKNEATNIGEWITHYINQGASKIILVDNNSTDQWREVVKPFLDNGKVEFREDLRPHAQGDIYRDILQDGTLSNYAWLLVCDLDEFVYARRGYQTIADFLNRFSLKGVGVVMLPWKNFGSCGHIEQPHSIRKGFIKRAKVPYPEAMPGFTRGKYLCRLSHTHDICIHNPILKAGHFTLASGRNLSGYLSSIKQGVVPISEAELENCFLHINHYPIQSRVYFKTIKAVRGDGFFKEPALQTKGDSYFHKFDINDILDDELAQIASNTEIRESPQLPKESRTSNTSSCQSHAGAGNVKNIRRLIRRMLQDGDIKDAAYALSVALKRYPSSPRLIDLAGEMVCRYRAELVALSLGKMAQGWLEQTLRHRRDDPDLLRASRDLWRTMGDGTTSLSFAKRIEKNKSSTAHDWCQLVELLLVQSMPRKAERCVTTALNRFPTDKQILTLASDVCRLRGKRRRSLAYARLLTQRHPFSWRGYARGIEELYLLQRPAEARQLVEQAQAAMKSTELVNRLTAGMRMEVSERWLGNHRTRQLMRAWHACQVWHDSFGVEMPLPMRVPGVPSIGLPKPSPLVPPQPIQYWSQGEPPADVQSLSKSWNVLLTELGLEPIQLFNRSSARDWIVEYTPEFASPFDTAFHVAVEADVFRLAYASIYDCLYLDADLTPEFSSKATLRVLLESPGSTLYIRTERPTLSNCFFLARNKCPLFALAARSGVHIDFQKHRKNRNTVMNTFGPDKYSYCLRHLCATSQERIRVAQLAPGVVNLHTKSFNLNLVNDQVISAPNPAKLNYKQTENHWLLAIE